MQIGRGEIAARGMLDRGLHDVGETHGAEAAQRLAPGLQRARRCDRLRPVEVLVVDGVEHVMRRAGLAAIGVGLHRQRHRALAVDEAMAAVRGADMRHAAADDADHHRLDHGQREQGRDRGIDGVAAGGQHLRTRGGGQRMVAHHHAAAAMRRLFLAREMCRRPVAPIAAHDPSPRSCWEDVSGNRGRGQASPALAPGSILHSGSVSPEPPSSAGKSFILGRPSFIRKTVSP